MNTNKTTTAAAKTTTATTDADKVDVSAIADRLVKSTEASTREGKALGGASLKVAQILREKGDSGAGMTAREVMVVTGKDAKETRKRIRMAMDAAANAGDLCVAQKNGGGAGQTKEYRIIRKALADQLPTEAVNKVRDAADDFAFGGTFKGRFAPDAE